MFVIPRGATQSFVVTVKDAVGEPIVLDAWRIYVTVRLSDVVILAKANALGGGSAAQIEVIAPGQFRVKFVNADTSREPCIASIDGFIVKEPDYIQVIKPQAFQITAAMTRAFPVPP